MEQPLLYIILYRIAEADVRYVNVTDAREELLNIVKNAEPVTITRNGRPAVVIVPFDEYQQLAALRDATRDPDEFLTALNAHKAVQRGARITGVPESEIAERLREIEKDIKQLQSSVQRIDSSVSSKATA